MAAGPVMRRLLFRVELILVFMAAQNVRSLPAIFPVMEHQLRYSPYRDSRPRVVWAWGLSMVDSRRKRSKSAACTEASFLYMREKYCRFATAARTSRPAIPGNIRRDLARKPGGAKGNPRDRTLLFSKFQIKKSGEVRDRFLACHGKNHFFREVTEFLIAVTGGLAKDFHGFRLGAVVLCHNDPAGQVNGRAVGHGC